MQPKADFHIHTTFSDGTLTPTEIVKRFKQEEYDIIAITDHDGFAGVAEAKIAGEALELTVIPGIEFATCLRGVQAREWGIEIKHDIPVSEAGGIPDEDGILFTNGDEINAHLLGYRFDTSDSEMLRMTERIRQCRKERNEKLLSVLTDMGYPISYEELLEGKSYDYIGKPNVALMLVKKGYISTASEAFEKGRFLESPEVYAIQKSRLDIIRAINLISAAGGTPVLAHPMKIKRLGERGSDEFWTNLDKMLRGLKKNGLRGLECFHSSHSHEEALRLVDFAEKYHLHITNGSDFHGDEFK